MQDRLQNLQQFIEDRLTEWQVPGLSVAIIKDGEIILTEGYGVRDITTGAKVDAQTVFAIASVSKAFTTMAMGMLVDEGKLNWDTPVKTYLPDFKLYDTYLTDHLTPRDMVCHRSGVSRHDAIWYNNQNTTRAELVKRMRYLEPNAGFRQLWQYNNMMYIAAGHLVEQVAGVSYEEFVQKRIFEPLNMQNSSFTIAESQQNPNLAYPHGLHQGETIKIDLLNVDLLGPAGSINSSVEDLANWALLHLNQGEFANQRLISTTNLKQMHTPQMVVPTDRNFREISHRMYGLGWSIEPYRGYNVVRHSGGIDGFCTLVTFMPEENIGVVVLTNREDNPLTYVVSYHIYDLLLGLDTIDWNTRLREEQEQLKSQDDAEKAAQLAQRVANTTTSHPLSDFVGSYQQAAYGEVRVQAAGDRLELIYNDIVYELTHHHYDVFVARHAAPSYNYTNLVSFATDALTGQIASMSLTFEQELGTKQTVFTRVQNTF